MERHDDLGFPGDGINGLLGALRRHQDQLRFVQTRHEDMAAFMAWADPGMVVLVLTNEDLHQVTWEQRVMEGDPEFKVSQELPHVDYAAWAELIGLTGIKVTKGAEIEDAWRRALSANRPVIISALTDLNEAPLSPHITFEQAEGFARSILADPEGGMLGAIESMLDTAREFLPGR